MGVRAIYVVGALLAYCEGEQAARSGRGSECDLEWVHVQIRYGVMWRRALWVRWGIMLLCCLAYVGDVLWPNGETVACVIRRLGWLHVPVHTAVMRGVRGLRAVTRKVALNLEGNMGCAHAPLVHVCMSVGAGFKTASTPGHSRVRLIQPSEGVGGRAMEASNFLLSM